MKLLLVFLLAPMLAIAQGPSRVECRIYWGEGGSPEGGGGTSYRNSFILERFDDDEDYVLNYQYGTSSYQLASDLKCKFNEKDGALFQCDNDVKKIRNCVRVKSDGLLRTVVTKQSCLEKIPVTIKTHEFIQTTSLESGGCFTE